MEPKLENKDNTSFINVKGVEEKLKEETKEFIDVIKDMTKEDNKYVYVLLEDSNPVCSSDDISKFDDEINQIIHKYTIKYMDIGNIYVDKKENDSYVLTLLNKNSFWNTEQFIVKISVCKTHFI